MDQSIDWLDFERPLTDGGCNHGDDDDDGNGDVDHDYLCKKQWFKTTSNLNFQFSDIDECASVTCQNGGTCVDLVGSYRCDCKKGYSGNNCETGEHYIGDFKTIELRMLLICYKTLNNYLLELPVTHL